MVVTMFAACGKKDEEPSQPNVSVDATQGDAEGDEAGFEEIEIFSDEEVGFMNVNAVYFQPVPMSGGYENYEDFDLHLECDVSALENSLGYGLGDWVPYLTVDYEVIASDGSTAADGAFMVMAASDGPHYGANIKLPNADTYSLKFTFHSPAENGYVIHLDDVTGPGGTLDDYFANGPLVLEMPDCWNYIPREW
ncbi:MAG: iron transporter [Clostridia bacterium]|nr:iron transporter [Clostridia bacterium]